MHRNRLLGSGDDNATSYNVFILTKPAWEVAVDGDEGAQWKSYYTWEDVSIHFLVFLEISFLSVVSFFTAFAMTESAARCRFVHVHHQRHYMSLSISSFFLVLAMRLSILTIDSVG
jgi:hypothetical protein